MSGKIVIDSEVLNRKIDITYERIRVLDDLYDKLLQIKEKDTENEKAELSQMLREVRQMKQTTEEIYELLKDFLYSIEDVMLQNKRKLSELQEMIEYLFI